jgi:hypothetical protein
MPAEPSFEDRLHLLDLGSLHIRVGRVLVVLFGTTSDGGIYFLSIQLKSSRRYKHMA